MAEGPSQQYAGIPRSWCCTSHAVSRCPPETPLRREDKALVGRSSKITRGSQRLRGFTRRTPPRIVRFVPEALSREASNTGPAGGGGE